MATVVRCAGTHPRPTLLPMEHDAVQLVAVTVPAATVATIIPTHLRSADVKLALPPLGPATADGAPNLTS